MAFLATGIFSACSDDDDNKAPDSKPEEVKPDDKHSEQATALLKLEWLPCLLKLC